ncbi:WASH complex subunit 2 [Microplitis demolitor]|uniref:WASH complex subunit 2 n=1 Tax=Microplitis demolitor TaxID=69319 RepID=UPI0004CD16F2|nr:WASH complex subunit 2 [Microplitis demolitor]
MNSTEWRSTDANSDFCLDDSISDTINTSFMSSNTQKDGNSSFTSEEGLLNALSNLSIESARKNRKSRPRRSSQSDGDLDLSFEDCQDLSSNTQIDVSVNNTVIHDPSQSVDAETDAAGKEVADNHVNRHPETIYEQSQPVGAETDAAGKEVPDNHINEHPEIINEPSQVDIETNDQIIDTPKNDNQELVSDFHTDNTTKHDINVPDLKLNDIPINNDSHKIVLDADDQKIMNKSIKAVSNQSAKKSKPASPSLLPKPKPRNVNTSLNQSAVKDNTKKSSVKHVVKTIVDTTDGIQVKDEQINYFGIPVIARRKTRTQVQPFSFLARGKNSNTSQNIKNKTSDVVEKVANKTLTGTADKVNKTLTNKKVPSASSKILDKSIASRVSTATSTAKTTTKSLNSTRSITKVNQENKTPNVATDTAPKTKPKVISKPTIGPPKLHTDKRAKERHEFDVQIRQKQLEIDRMRALLEQKQREKEKLEELALRKTMEPKAHPMPEFKTPAPIRSFKPLTEPQSPATWAINHKKH